MLPAAFIRFTAFLAQLLKIGVRRADHHGQISQSRQHSAMGNIESNHGESLGAVDSLKYRLQSLEEAIRSIEVGHRLATITLWIPGCFYSANIPEESVLCQQHRSASFKGGGFGQACKMTAEPVGTPLQPNRVYLPCVTWPRTP